MNAIKLKVSPGNTKMGLIPSVSLPPIMTCRPDAPCKKDCYACKLCRIYKTVKAAYQSNLDLLNESWDGYFSQLDAAIKTTRYFRLHVSGDFPNAAYFKACVIVAKNNPGTTILAFTKQYEIVNNYINKCGALPENFKVILSSWGAWKCDNPYNLPTSEVIFKGDAVPDNWKICGGNCAECACRGVGCWELRGGETIAFYKH